MSWPVPLWCTAESTGPVSRSGAAGAAPLLDAHFQHPGCIHPQSFWTNCEWTCETEDSYTLSHKHKCSFGNPCFIKSEQCHCLGQSVLTSLLSLCPTRQQFWHEAVLPVHKTWRPYALNFIRVSRIKYVASDFWASFKMHWPQCWAWKNPHPRWLGVALPLHGGMTKWLLLLRQ